MTLFDLELSFESRYLNRAFIAPLSSPPDVIITKWMWLLHLASIDTNAMSLQRVGRLPHRALSTNGHVDLLPRFSRYYGPPRILIVQHLGQSCRTLRLYRPLQNCLEYHLELSNHDLRLYLGRRSPQHSTAQTPTHICSAQRSASSQSLMGLGPLPSLGVVGPLDQPVPASVA